MSIWTLAPHRSEEIWMLVYAAAIQLGCDTDHAVRKANIAVEQFNVRWRS